MSDVNLYFALLDPKGVLQRIMSGDLGKEKEDWTIDMLLSDEDDWARMFKRVSDKVAKADNISKEYGFNSSSYTILGDGWVELAVEARSMMGAIVLINEYIAKEQKYHV